MSDTGCFELKVTGFYLAFVFTASLSEVENGLNHAEFANFLGHLDQADLQHRGLQGFRWKLDVCAF